MLLSSDMASASRRDHFEFFPVVLAPCLSWTCLATVKLSFEGELRDFSLGLLLLQEYSYDMNLADSVGKLSSSWGIVQNSSREPAAIWSNGKQTHVLNRPIRSGDCISFYLDLNDGHSGSLHVFLNHRLLHSIGQLDCEQRYGMACTMASNSSVSILRDSSIRQTVEDALAEGSSAMEDEDQQMEAVSVKVHAAPLPIDRTSLRVEDEAVEVLLSAPSSSSAAPVPAFFRAPPCPSLLASRPAVRKDADASSSLECCICLSAARCMLFMPCKHLCACEACGADHQPDSGRKPLEHCPMCRLRIKSRIKVYL